MAHIRDPNHLGGVLAHHGKLTGRAYAYDCPVPHTLYVRADHGAESATIRDAHGSVFVLSAGPSQTLDPAAGDHNHPLSDDPIACSAECAAAGHGLWTTLWKADVQAGPNEVTVALPPGAEPTHITLVLTLRAIGT